VEEKTKGVTKRKCKRNPVLSPTKRSFWPTSVYSSSPWSTKAFSYL